MFHLLLQRGDLLQPSDVAVAAVEPRFEKLRDELCGERRPDDLGAETQDVHVVVLHALVRAVPVMADRRADTDHLARRNRRADAGTAHEHGTLRLAALDRFADLTRLVGVVDTHGVGICAEVDDVVAGQCREDGFSEVHAAMVERDGDLHRYATRCSSAAAFATTFSTLKPNSERTVPPGADAPKCSIDTDAPRSPTHSLQPSATPASIERRAVTSGGSTSSR